MVQNSNQNQIENQTNSACDSILQRIRSSGLHFCCQETPWSVYVTLRKSFIQSNMNQTSLSSSTAESTAANLPMTSEITHLKSELENLKHSYKELEKASENVKNDLEEAIQDCDDKQKAIENLKNLNQNLGEKNYELEVASWLLYLP